MWKKQDASFEARWNTASAKTDQSLERCCPNESVRMRAWSWVKLKDKLKDTHLITYRPLSGMMVDAMTVPMTDYFRNEVLLAKRAYLPLKDTYFSFGPSLM